MSQNSDSVVQTSDMTSNSECESVRDGDIRSSDTDITSDEGRESIISHVQGIKLL